MPCSCSARTTRTATSPRFPTRTRENITSKRVERPAVRRLELEQQLPVLDGLAVLDGDRADDRLDVGLDLVHELHRLQDAERLPRRHRVALLDERRRARLGRAIERADHRSLDAHDTVRRRRRWRRLGLRGRCEGGADGRHLGWSSILTPSDGDAQPRLLDRKLADAGLLDDPHQLPDALGAALVDAAADERVVTARAAPDRLEEWLRLDPEQRQQQELLLARGQALGLVADRFEVGRRLVGRHISREQLDRALDGGIERRGRRPERALHEIAKLVHDQAVPRRREHVDERLRAENLADRRGQRRPAGLGADPPELVEHLVDPVAGGMRPELRIEARDQPGRDVVLRGATRGARGVTGSSPMCSSTRSAARQSASTSTPLSRPSPASACASASPETRWRVRATGYTAHAMRSAPARAASSASASPFPAEPWLYIPTGRPDASAIAETSSYARCGASEPEGSC